MAVTKAIVSKLTLANYHGPLLHNLYLIPGELKLTQLSLLKLKSYAMLKDVGCNIPAGHCLIAVFLLVVEAKFAPSHTNRIININKL